MAQFEYLDLAGLQTYDAKIKAVIATKVDKLHAVCMKCGCDHGTRTQRLIDGKPADKNSKKNAG